MDVVFRFCENCGKTDPDLNLNRVVLEGPCRTVTLAYCDVCVERNQEDAVVQKEALVNEWRTHIFEAD